MKRILTLILVLALALTMLASCDQLSQIIPGLGGNQACTEHVDADSNYVCDNCGAELEKPHEHNFVEGKCECGEEDPNYVPPHEHNFVKGECECGEVDPNYVDEDLQAAADYIRQMYKDDPKATSSDYSLIGSAFGYAITWTVDSEEIQVVVNEDGSVTIDVPNEEGEPYSDITYVLTATISNEDGDTLSKSFEHVVPKFKVNTWEEYMAAKEGDNLIVDGIVVAINSKSLGNTRNHLFLLDATGCGGYYSYQMDQDPVAELGIEVGMTVRVTGPATPYDPMMEIKGGTAKILDETIKKFDYIDITEKFVKDANFAEFVALPVIIKGVTLGGQELETSSSQYLFFTLNGVESYVRTYVTDFPTTLKAEDKATIDTLHSEKFGYTADVYGIFIMYGKTPYIIPTAVNCFNNFQLPERSDAEKLELELSGISVPGNVTEDSVIELPLVGGTYSDVVLSWISDNACAVVEGGKLTVTLPEEKATVTLTLTATIGELTETKTYEIKVDAASTDLYVPESVTKPVADKAYKFYFVQGSLGETLYITGEVSGRYLVTTDKADAAADVYVEAVEGGYKFYILVDGAKQYITVYKNADNKDSVKFDAEGTTVYTYNETVNAWVTNLDGTDKYLGTYSTYNTVSVSNLSYITAENTGVSQFPAGFATLAPAVLVPESVTKPAADKAYKFYFVQGSLGETLYITGEVSGRYLVTTDKADAAADVYVEAVEGGYKFYILVDGAKQYITVYKNADNKDSVKFDAEGTTVYTYNETVNAWVTNLDGTDKYLGTYSTYNTVSVSNLSYITAENTGVSQFPAGLATIEIVIDHVCKFEAATCTKPATCSCGKTEGEALGHNISENVCANCGAKVVTVTEGAALEDGTLVFIEATVTKITYAWSDKYGNMSVDITDGTTTLNAYKLASKVGVGDVIVIYGKIGSYNDVKQIAEGATAEIKTAHVCSEYTNATCTAAAACVVCGAENGEALGHNYVNGVCDREGCGAEEPVAGETTTVNVSIADYATANSWVDATLYAELQFDANVKVSSSGTPVGTYGLNTGKYYASNTTWRIYQNETPSVVITAAEGKTIVSVKITYSVKNSGTLTLDGEAIASGTVVEVNANSVTFSVGNTGTATNGQAQITAIEVIYK